MRPESPAGQVGRWWGGNGGGGGGAVVGAVAAAGEVRSAGGAGEQTPARNAAPSAPVRTRVAGAQGRGKGAVQRAARASLLVKRPVMTSCEGSRKRMYTRVA